jgi:predicted nucleic-acid-binding protein
LIGVDTNVLVRYLVEDDAAQAEEAALFLRTRCSTETPAFVNRIVVAELVWVLGHRPALVPSFRSRP